MIHSMLYLRAIQEKYVKMYERYVYQLKEYSQAIRILSKGYLPISLLLPSRLAKILDEVKKALAKTNKNYGLVLTGIYKYFNKTDVKTSILDGGYEIILANWPSFKGIVCTTYNNIPIEILSHPYVLLNRMVLL